MMKKILYILAAVLLLTSCEKDPFQAFLAKGSNSPSGNMIWDIGPVELIIEVKDKQGNNLFDESTPGNWLETPFLATFDGKEFRWPASLPWAGTKAYLATLRGFYIYPQWYLPTDEVYLRFGELDGTKKWDTDLCIFWPDGSRDVIRVQHAFRWNETGYPEFYTGYKVNGIPVEGRLLRFTK